MDWNIVIETILGILGVIVFWALCGVGIYFKIRERGEKQKKYIIETVVWVLVAIIASLIAGFK